MTGICWDFSERKLAEDALRQSEERYRTLFSSLIEGFCIIEVLFDENDRPIDYRFLETNSAFETQTGLLNVQGKRMRELAPEHEAHWFELYGKVALTGEPARFVNEAKALNRWYDVSAYRVDGADSCKVAILFNDITNAKLAEKVLTESNEELENRVRERTGELASTIENLNVEIVKRELAEESVIRLNSLYKVVSETSQAIVRTMDRETIFNEFCRIAVDDGKFKLAWVGLVDEESGVLSIVAAKGETGYLDDIKITANVELTGIGPTGISVREGTYYICNDFLGSPVTRPWHERGRAHGIRASASIALKQEGQVIGALTLYADKKDFFDQQQTELLQQMGADVSFALDNIVRETRRKEAERALRDETIERLWATEALREKEQMLIQQSRQAAMGEMIGNIAHQWRQPLNTLGLTVQQLSLYYDLGEFTKEFLDNSVDKSMGLIQHMSQTIDDFRNYFRPDKEKVKFKVQEAIASTLILIEDSFKSQQIGIELVAKGDPVIHGFRNEFAQVVLNILNNARDVLMEREIKDPKVTITIGSENDRAVVIIADNAGGIPEEIMGKIFDPYFTTKGPQAGTGVGLFMSKTIIDKNLGGSLTAQNIAAGAEFRIEV
jgi:PAS domain S-box-containing protein